MQKLALAESFIGNVASLLSVTSSGEDSGEVKLSIHDKGDRSYKEGHAWPNQWREWLDLGLALA